LQFAASLAAIGLSRCSTAPAGAAEEQFFPVLAYRTGAYAPNGTPWANGYVDYLKLVNARGGVNGVKIIFEECETGYATDRGVECYERLKGKHGGATVVQPLSTGITFALTEKAPVDKIPLITAGYGRSESQDGSVFGWNFPLIGTYWMGADVLMQHIAKKEGGFDKLKGKKIALVYHDSPYGKEPIAAAAGARQDAWLRLQLLPVAHPGVEQKATWLQIRQNKPDYVFLWGWGVMNSTSIKEAQATGYPREKMYGIWWAGAEPDVKDVGDGAKGYNALAMQHGAEPNSKVVKEVLEKGACQGPGHRSQGRSRPGAVHARPDLRHARSRACARRRSASARASASPASRCAGAWRTSTSTRKSWTRMGFGRRDAPGADLLPRPHGFGLGACIPGTARSGTSRPTGTRATRRFCARW
jgi:branched-chain amino acid transport system substrate-binding protein